MTYNTAELAIKLGVSQSYVHKNLRPIGKRITGMDGMGPLIIYSEQEVIKYIFNNAILEAQTVAVKPADMPDSCRSVKSFTRARKDISWHKIDVHYIDEIMPASLDELLTADVLAQGRSYELAYRIAFAEGMIRVKLKGCTWYIATKSDNRDCVIIIDDLGS